MSHVPLAEPGPRAPHPWVWSVLYFPFGLTFGFPSIALGLVSVGFITMASLPLSPRTMPLLALVVLLTSTAGTFIAFATEGLMTHNTPPDGRGRSAGWFQAGNQFAQTAGGGIGLWFMTHVPKPWMAGAALAAILWICSLALFLVEEPPRHLHHG